MIKGREWRKHVIIGEYRHVFRLNTFCFGFLKFYLIFIREREGYTAVEVEIRGDREMENKPRRYGDKNNKEGGGGERNTHNNPVLLLLLLLYLSY